MSDDSEALPQGYGRTVERIYTAGHPEVVRLTRYYRQRVEARGIYPSVERSLPPGPVTAEVVANAWYAFTDFMPGFLCRAAGAMTSNQKRHFVIQTAYEELGLNDENEIHPEMFRRACAALGVMIGENSGCVHDTLMNLEQRRKSGSDAFVFGLLLGLEAPAEENIETLFAQLAYTPALRDVAGDTRFFRIHKRIELEHVRLCVANVLRFCSLPGDRDDCDRGFACALAFWADFWFRISDCVASASD